jgi:hypothetical protein
MTILKLVGLCLLFGVAGADETRVKKQQILIEELTLEYRLRIQAQDFLADVALFDDMGTLGRGIAVGQPVVADNESPVGNELPTDTESIAATGGTRLPGLAVGPPIELLPVSSISLEMNHSDFDPLVDLQLEIKEVQEAILKAKQAKKQKRNAF